MQTTMNTSEELFHLVLAASVRGKSHERQLCQDAHHCCQGVFGAVADGAVRQLWGKWGYRCRSNSCRNNTLKDPTPRSPDDEEGWQLLLTKALAAAKTAVEAEDSM